MAKSFVPTNEADLKHFLDELDSESKRAKEAWPDNKKWDRFAELSRGQDIYGKRENPIFQADIISPTVNRKTALLTESEPIIDIGPRRPGLDNTAQILKEDIQAIWQTQSVQMGLEALRSYMGAFGCGGMRVMWDKSAAYGMGDIILPAIDPRTIRFDPAVTKAYDLQRGKCQYIGPIESVRSMSEIAERFPSKADKLRPSRITALTGKQAKTGFWAGLKGALSTSTGLSRGQRSSGGAADYEGAVPRLYVREYWVDDPSQDDNEQRIYPGGRLFIRCGQSDDDIIVNFDQDAKKDKTSNPYFDGLFDLEWLDNTPDLDHPWGRSEVGALRFLQETFNRQGNLIVKAGLRNGFPWILAPNNALQPDKIRELEDLEQIVVQYQLGREIKREVPPIAPEQQMAMMNMILTLADFIVGTGDSGMKGQGRIEQRSGEQLEGLQRAGQVLVRAEARRLEAFLERIGAKIISRIFQFWTDDRQMLYYGGGETFTKYVSERKKLVSEIQMFAVKNAQKKAGVDPKSGQPIKPELDDIVDAMLTAIKGAWRDFSFKIIPESSLATTRIQRAMLIFQLAQAGMSPKKDVLQIVGIPNPEEKVQQAMQEMVEENAMRQSLGLPPPEPPNKKAGGGKKK